MRVFKAAKKFDLVSYYALQFSVYDVYATGVVGSLPELFKFSNRLSKEITIY